MTLKIGIQGGVGSFNEEACRTYCADNGIADYAIEYLYTSDRVLEALAAGLIDRGIFAIENSIGGLVWESVEALSRYNCAIVSSFEILINHCLLVVPGTDVSFIDTIMSHPQALAQTRATVAGRYPHRNRVSGEGILVDQATAAKALAEGKLPATTAVIASRVCADLFGLAIADEGLQDLKENWTTFLFVSSRP